MADGTIVFDTRLDNEHLENQLTGLEGMIKKGLGALSLVAVTKGVVDLVSGITNVGMSFESAFADAIKTIDATDEQIAELRGGFRDMALEIPLAVEEIASIGAAAGQLGIATDNIESFTRVMADLGVATNMTSTEAATSLARLANITNMPQENFDRLGSTVVALGNNLATTESEIVDMALRLAGAGNQAGLSEAQILSMAGALSSLGLESQAGGSAFSRVMQQIQLAVETNSGRLEEFAEVAGMSAEEFANAFRDDATTAIIAFVNGLGDMDAHGKSAVQLLSDMEIKERNMTDALLRASGAQDTFNAAFDIGNQAWAENTALTAEAEQRYATLESQLVLLGNSARDIGITIYDAFSDNLREAARVGITALNDIGNRMRSGDLRQPVEQLGNAIGSAFTTLAGAIEKVLPTIIRVATTIVDNIDKILAGVALLQAIKIGNNIFSGLSTAANVAGKYADAMALAAEAGKKFQGHITPLQGVMGTLTGKLTGTEAAVAVFGKTMGTAVASFAPWAAGLAIVGGAIAMVVADMNRVPESTREVISAIDEQIAASSRLAETQSNARAAGEDNIAVAIEEAAATQELAARIDELAGKANKTAEEQAELNAAISEMNRIDPNLGLIYDDATDRIYRLIDGNKEYVDSIEMIIAAKMAELELAAREEYVIDLMKQRAATQRQIQENERAMRDIAEERGTLEAQLAEKRAKYDEAAARGTNVTFGEYQRLGWEITELEQGIDALNSKEQELNGTHSELSDELGNVSDALKDEQDAIAATTAEMERNRAELEAQNRISREAAAGLLELAESAAELPPASREAQEAYEQLSEATNREITGPESLQALITEIRNLGPTTQEGIEEYNALMEVLSSTQTTTDEAAAAYQRLSEIFGMEINADNILAINDIMKDVPGAMNVAGTESGQAYVDGVNSRISEGDPSAAIGSMINKGIGSGQSAAQQAGIPIGSSFDSGVASGMAGYETAQAAADMLSEAIGTADTTAQGAGVVGSTLSSNAASGMSSRQVSAAANAIINAAITAGNVIAANASSIGASFASGIAGGISSGTRAITSAATRAANSAAAAAKRALGIASPSKVMYYYGQMVSQGLADGIDANTRAVVYAAEVMIFEGLYAVRRNIMSEMNALEKALVAEGQKLTAAYNGIQGELNKIEAERAADNARAREKARKEDLANLEKAIADAKKAEYKNIGEKNAAINKATKALNDAKEKYRQEDAENARKAREAELKAEQDRIQELQKNYDKIIKDFESAKADYIAQFDKGLADIRAKRDAFAKKLIDAGDLYTTTQRGRREVYSLTDLNAQAQEIAAYGDTMARLIERGVPDSILDEIGTMSMKDAKQYMMALNNLTDTEYRQYIAAWEERQRQADRVAAQYYARTQQKLEDEHNQNIIKLNSELNASMEQFHAEATAAATAAGYKSGQQYMRAMANGVKSASEELDIVILDTLMHSTSFSPASFLASNRAMAFSGANTITTTNHVTERIGKIGFDTSNVSDLARILRPYLQMEDNRVGSSIIKRGV